MSKTEKEWTWHYRARKRIVNGKPIYDVVEWYGKYGWTEEGIKPMGESRSELISTLEMMLDDVKHCRTLVEKEECKKLKKLKRHKCLTVDPQDIVQIDWSKGDNQTK